MVNVEGFEPSSPLGRQSYRLERLAVSASHPKIGANDPIRTDSKRVEASYAGQLNTTLALVATLRIERSFLVLQTSTLTFSVKGPKMVREARIERA